MSGVVAGAPAGPATGAVEDGWGAVPVDSTGITVGAGIPEADLAGMFAAIDTGRTTGGAR